MYICALATLQNKVIVKSSIVMTQLNYYINQNFLYVRNTFFFQGYIQLLHTSGQTNGALITTILLNYTCAIENLQNVSPYL